MPCLPGRCLPVAADQGGVRGDGERTCSGGGLHRVWDPYKPGQSYSLVGKICKYIAYWLVQVVEAEPGLGFLQDPLAVSAMDAPDMDRP